ncbi:hypothetical protein V474_07745 [Novosphingobium barchaimii LL02]|uniref:Rho termination factor N-terminal domain-containing protein n=1 Tax=Novosphingobium barchaimii LL02 TaxID=1114963 RepID=A0A0J7Y8Q0_9SPHN|nr:hypothetical protein [Novosphingobium barchaimii]KMS59982.1 hypothetical protein V474_07745 [Novosphingobium barchaimii LL02]
MKYKVTNNDFRTKAFQTPDGVKLVAPGDTATVHVSQPIGEVEGLKAELLDGEGYEEMDAPDITKMTVAELKTFAETNGIDLGEATKKDDILAAIELANEPKF